MYYTKNRGFKNHGFLRHGLCGEKLARDFADFLNHEEHEKREKVSKSVKKCKKMQERTKKHEIVNHGFTRIHTDLSATKAQRHE